MILLKYYNKKFKKLNNKKIDLIKIIIKFLNKLDKNNKDLLSFLMKYIIYN